MTKQQEAEARAELRPIIDALRAWNNKYNVVDNDGDLYLSLCIIDEPAIGEKYFNAFNNPVCSPHFDFTIRD